MTDETTESKEAREAREAKGKRGQRIPAGQLSAYEKWELPAIHGEHVVGGGSRPPVETEDLAVEPLTAEQIEEIREAARRDGHEEGRLEGLEAGQKEGREAGLKELRAQADRLAQITAKLVQPAADEERDLEAALVELVVRVARAVVQRELIADSSQISTIVHEAVQALPEGSKRLRLRVNPADLDNLEASGAAIDGDWQLVPDPAIQPGGVHVENEQSLVDFTVGERFDDVVSELVRKRYETPSESDMETAAAAARSAASAAKESIDFEDPADVFPEVADDAGSESPADPADDEPGGEPL